MKPVRTNPNLFPSFRISYAETGSADAIARRLAPVFQNVPSERPIVIVCIGTDRSTGDALGPLVGTFLKKTEPSDFFVYGTLDEPVHAVNLRDTLDEIKKRFSSPFIVGVDACLGQASSVGYIQIGDGPVKPGAGVSKELPPVGDIHITGVVNVYGFMEYFVLQNTRLSLVMNMAEVISRSLQRALAGVRRLAVGEL